MLTMNTAKVKKSKKIKSSTVNEHDESVLEFEVRLLSFGRQHHLTNGIRGSYDFKFLVDKHCKKIFIKAERNLEKEKS